MRPTERLALSRIYDMTTIPTLHLGDVIRDYTQDMTGRIAAVTGTTSGTGYVCARELAKRGAVVLLLNRESERSISSLKKLRDEVPSAVFQEVPCDLQDFTSIWAAIDIIRASHKHLDVLCNNAGVMAMKDEATKDGYDVQMQTNVLSHFLLTKGVFELLRKSDAARIVNHSSMARVGPPLERRFFEKNGGDLGGDGDESEGFGGPRWARYHQTKLANFVFTYGLKEKLEAAEITNIKALVAHPGLARTQLQVTTEKAGGMDATSDFMKQAQSQEDGAAGIIRACMDPEAQSGDFFGPEQWSGFPNRLTPEEDLVTPENIRTNWEGCEGAVGKFTI
ncbi:MAG: NAD(P)-dependent dehydrogenase (short-subunit alcohol dehydrogenase family) [Polyangiales bacterium]|jgi:NAD(P)-dependent dehydrogenase (short-subunit alcohol dehydrogenase family)